MMFESLLFSMCRRFTNANQYHYNMKYGELSRENGVFDEICLISTQIRRCLHAMRIWENLTNERKNSKIRILYTEGVVSFWTFIYGCLRCW